MSFLLSFFYTTIKNFSIFDRHVTLCIAHNKFINMHSIFIYVCSRTPLLKYCYEIAIDPNFIKTIIKSFLFLLSPEFWTLFILQSSSSLSKWLVKQVKYLHNSFSVTILLTLNVRLSLCIHHPKISQEKVH